MGFTITKAKPKGDQSRQTQKRKVAGKKRASARASNRRTRAEVQKLMDDPRLQSIQNFMGKTGYGGMSKGASGKKKTKSKKR